METLEIRPRLGRNVWLLAVACVIFTLTGIFMLLVGSLTEKFAGVISIAFFGGLGSVALRRMSARPVTMRLTPNELQQVYPEGTTTIPWRDIEEIGQASVNGTKLVGLRLNSYEHLLSSMSPELAAQAQRGLQYLRPMAAGAMVVNTLESTNLVVRSERPDAETDKAEEGLASLDSFTSALQWNRAKLGYDVALSWAERDRSAEDFARLLETYRVAAQQRTNVADEQQPAVTTGAKEGVEPSGGAATIAPPQWASDPVGRHEYRYWDGSSWTDRVADRGIASRDPM